MDDTRENANGGDPDITATNGQTLIIAIPGRDQLRAACAAALLKQCDPLIEIVSAEAPADLAGQAMVDLALLPLFCPHESVFAGVGGAVRTWGDAPVAVLLDHADAQILNRLTMLGVRGILTLDLEMKVIAPALRLIVAGGVYVPPQRSAGIHSRSRPGPMPGAARPDLHHVVSPREQAVLDLLGRSLSNREIAQRLGIAEATVKIHVRNLLRKTRARNRVELALIAVRECA